MTSIYMHIVVLSRVCLRRESSQYIVQLVAQVLVFLVVGHSGESGHQRVLCADVERVVDPPVRVSHLARWMEQALL